MRAVRLTPTPCQKALSIMTPLTCRRAARAPYASGASCPTHQAEAAAPKPLRAHWCRSAHEARTRGSAPPRGAPAPRRKYAPA